MIQLTGRTEVHLKGLPVLAPGCQDPQGRIVASVHQLGYKKHPP